MRRSLFAADLQDLREVVRDSYAQEVVPQYADWQTEGAPLRHFWSTSGLLGIQAPEKEFGGGGQRRFQFNVILTEEAQHADIALGGI